MKSYGKGAGSDEGVVEALAKTNPALSAFKFY